MFVVQNKSTAIFLADALKNLRGAHDPAVSPLIQTADKPVYRVDVTNTTTWVARAYGTCRAVN
jgi:hypothetical protein